MFLISCVLKLWFTDQKEKAKFLPPTVQAGKTVMNKAREEDKPERDGGEKKDETAKPGKGTEHTGATKKKQKPKKRVKEEEMDGEGGAVVGMKRPKWEKTGSDEDGQTAKEKVMEKSKKEGMRDDEAQRPTANKYEIVEAVLESSISTLIEDTKAMLSEVESMQASIDRKTCRAEQEKEKGETKECSSVPSALDKESMKEMKNRPECKEEEREEENDSGSDEYVVWVQCSRADCGKWRKLSEDVDPSVLPDDWMCENNPDPAFCSCSVPEEQSSSSEEEIFFCSLVPGSLVWAWQSGHPWWPAMIERDPDTNNYLEFRKKTDLIPYKYHVTYFGDPVCIDWVFCSDVRNYADLSEDEVFDMLEQPELKKKLKDAICMSKQALKLSPQMRLMEFGFWSRYDSDRESSEEDSDIADVLELFGGKSGKYSDDENLWPKKLKRCLKKGEEKQRRREKSESKKRAKEMNGEKKENKSERESGKSVKRMQNGKIGVESARNSEEGGLKVNKQKDMEKKCFTPSFSLPKKNKPAHKADAEKQQVQDQTVPQGAMETTPDIRHPKGDMKTKVKVEKRDEEEDKERKKKKINRKENNKEKQSRRKVKRWEEDFSDEEDEEDGDDEGGFLDTDMEILGCRRKELKRLSCREEEEDEEEEEEQTDFSLMLLEEE
ncbi:zinc finger CW-type PWWP domain protein 1-like [Colossoma macropomum]|uniref:zinc finger CW-type PWWP domain protein 1-like n=1 Tax=Colossoma macropomum TaxID=42526 RepID=UPI001864547B|nr:zinc finger CW-type PWWP domain protein 1-like [Colossoma macropomum]